MNREKSFLVFLIGASVCAVGSILLIPGIFKSESFEAGRVAISAGLALASFFLAKNANRNRRDKHLL